MGSPASVKPATRERSAGPAPVTIPSRGSGVGSGPGPAGAAAEKVAPTVVVADTVTVQRPVPPQAPLQPANPLPAAGLAVSVTTLPPVTVSVQSAPQAIPGPVTLPAPGPAGTTVSA